MNSGNGIVACCVPVICSFLKKQEKAERDKNKDEEIEREVKKKIKKNPAC